MPPSASLRMWHASVRVLGLFSGDERLGALPTRISRVSNATVPYVDYKEANPVDRVQLPPGDGDETW